MLGINDVLQSSVISFFFCSNFGFNDIVVYVHGENSERKYYIDNDIVVLQEGRQFTKRHFFLFLILFSFFFRGVDILKVFVF